jgi:hypothetical protein
VGAVGRFEFEGDVRNNWLKLVRGIVALRCDYQAEYTNTLLGEMQCFAGLMLIQVLRYRNHSAVEDRSSFIIVSSSCRRML